MIAWKSSSGVAVREKTGHRYLTGNMEASESATCRVPSCDSNG